jgi:putative transcriptional regulator
MSRLAGRIERELDLAPHDPTAAIAATRRQTARDLPGVRAVLDRHGERQGRPESENAAWRVAGHVVGHTGRMADLRAGHLLVATPMLLDPNFAETVVLLLDADENGALGVVLNRPSTVPVADVLETWADVVAEPEVLFQGGPVSTEGALAVGRLRSLDDAPVGFREVTDDLGVIDLDTPVELVDGSLDGMRIYAGYAGWGAGQLESEIEEGSWYVVPSLPPDCFRDDTVGLWRDVLRRQPGEMAWHSTRPLDPDLN